MDLMPNQTFRVVEHPTSDPSLPPGIYRAILVEISIRKVIAVCIAPEYPPNELMSRGGRKRKDDHTLRTMRKKPPQPLIGKLHWLDTNALQCAFSEHAAMPIEVERMPATSHSDSAKRLHTQRVEFMSEFLNFDCLRESILQHQGIGDLAKRAIDQHGVSRAFLYKQWSNLCRWGLHAKSLLPLLHRCGAPNVRRPCVPALAHGQPTKKKAGRKTIKQRIALRYGVALEPDQPGVTIEWAAAIRAADDCIPTPKPAWPKRCGRIVMSAFCSKFKDVDGRPTLIKPEQGKYPNNAQIKRVLTEGKTRIERILERTTKHHFSSSLRGLIARNWQGVAGPGHTWAIDSTVGDIYLRSSVNRAWIVGRPIVYVIVDVWSTAVVGFYVCLTGPSWSTAKVSLFNAASDPQLISELWGYTPLLTLKPNPSICHALMCDRGEYLSIGHTQTAIQLLNITSYAPPYRGDLKGLVEVLHRIGKDAQFLFVPGAMDYRRKELELRKVNPEDCVLTVREYTQYLYQVFSEYNLVADRSHRVDAVMRGEGVFPSPAGLWAWGHRAGIGYRKFNHQSDLVELLLPQSTARVRRDCVRHAGNDYTSEEIDLSQWTATARNCGGWDIPIQYYPGSMGSIWAPGQNASELLRLHLSDESRALPELTFEDWLDVLAKETMDRAEESHVRQMAAVEFKERTSRLIDSAKQETTKALAQASGKSPLISEARLVEVAQAHPSHSESTVKQEVRDEAMDEHLALLSGLLRTADNDEHP
ncbi:transposase [Sphaerotilus sp.]|uniref:transposase n=1 Tax=Sphaerotilus sp. TaxID=2093942 RepID=UPI00286E84C6|nr:transposase [Sphaerotilus sp.]